MANDNNEFNIDMTELDDFFALCEAAGTGDFRKQIKVFFTAAGLDLLKIVKEEIVRKQVVDTRLLLNSFTRKQEGNTFKFSKGGLTLEVGTRINYASYVNDGHWANPQGVSTRFVPGYWSGDKFTYDRDAPTGMVLKQQWIEGRHYWDSALVIYEHIFKVSMDRQVQKWINGYFT